FVVGGPVGDSELLLCHGMVCVVGRMRDLILQLSKSSIYSTKPLSDRIRYYWPHSRIKNSVETMMVNLEGVDIPLGMISQYLPKQFERIQSGELSAIPHQLIMDKIYDVLRAYRYGCAE
ncbi:class II D-tagatose-bisphosphate aldolase non-catalytic subunit, partial [Escherichia coli]|uniref:class II D-tagatose-bisphosphate aldolase non-catalytic subunit n=1 Tax=Escherichia coli TaxID=562 RepID=UPI003F773911